MCPTGILEMINVTPNKRQNLCEIYLKNPTFVMKPDASTGECKWMTNARRPDNVHNPL